MKISIDARGINWYRGTGIGTYTENVLKNLLNIDNENFYNLYWSGENYENFIKDNSKIIMASKKHHRFFEQNYFPRNINKENIDIYHVPQNGIGVFPGTNCKKVATIHDLIPYIMPETVGKGYLIKFLREIPQVIDNCHALITVSEHSKKDILRFFPIDENKIFVTPLAADKKYKPLDKNFCKNELKQHFNIDSDFILYLGGFSARKNVAGLIKAFHKSYENFNSNCKLVIIGSIKDEAKSLLGLTESLKLKDEVIFTGFVEEHWLPIFYNACSCFVYPSFYEGFGLPPLEAMSCGTPVIASSLSSIPEVIGDAGILINPYDCESISEALCIMMCDHNKRMDFSEKALNRSKDFSWEKTAVLTLKVYESLNV